MSKTNIEHFNSYFKLFVNNIISTFPEHKEILENYYDDLLETDVCNNDKYVKRFVVKMKDFKKQISEKNNDLFSESVYILKNIDFKELWESTDLGDSNKEKIWEYIQTLFILSETIVNDSNTVKNLVKSIKKLQNKDESAEDAKEDNDAEEMEGVDNDIFNMLKNLSDENKNTTLDPDFLENGLLGKLASELTEELDLSDMNLENSENVNDVFTNLISGDNPMKFMNLIQTVGQKIQGKVESGSFNQADLFSEAQKMMGCLQNDDSMKMFNDLVNKQSEEFNDSNSTSNPTRDRLRKKLEDKKNNKAN